MFDSILERIFERVFFLLSRAPDLLGQLAHFEHEGVGEGHLPHDGVLGPRLVDLPRRADLPVPSKDHTTTVEPRIEYFRLNMASAID